MIKNKKMDNDNTKDEAERKTNSEISSNPSSNKINLANDLKLNQLEAVNLELEKNIEKMKRKHKGSKFKKKINILKSSYLLTYKSLNPKKILFF